jgi:hypothetical protein
VRDSLQVKEMQRSLSSRMRIRFKNNSAQNITFLIQPDHKYAGLGKFTEEERILKGFMWKPKERPISKESILPSYGRKHNPPAPRPKPGVVKKPGAGNAPPAKGEMAGDSTSSRETPLTTGNDSTDVKSTPVIKRDSAGVKAAPPAINTKKDKTDVKTSPAIETKKDSTGIKTTPPVIKKDSVATKKKP